jgi:hypothetical protein
LNIPKPHDFFMTASPPPRRAFPLTSSTTALSTLKKPMFCSNSEVEFSPYNEVIIPVGVFAMITSARTSDPTD